jgi:cellulose synthase/poly-beta-1,6-N-acetylglucosamine synthase-like glycosyltransferase
MLKAVETIEAVKGCRRAGYSSYYNAKNRGFLFTIYRERERRAARCCSYTYLPASTIYASSFVFPCFNEHHSSTILSLSSVCWWWCSSGATTAYICAADATAAHLNSCAPPSIPTPIVRGHC